MRLTELALRRAGAADLEEFQRREGLYPSGQEDILTMQRLTPLLLGYERYMVKPGDTYYRIATARGTSVRAMLTANPNQNPNLLIPGQYLNVPYGFPVVPTDIPFSSELLQICVQGLLVRYPFLSQKCIARTAWGRPVTALRIGQGPRCVLYNASHHANEWITTPVLLQFLQQYAYAVATEGRILGMDAQQLWRRTTLWLVPMVNPDGVDLVTGAIRPGSQQYQAAQRIAAGFPEIPFPGGWKANLTGTDLNLNYPAGWEQARTNKFALGFTGPAPRDYVGASPLDQPETAAMAALTQAIRPDVTLSYHTQGEEIYWRFQDYAPPGARSSASGWRGSAATGWRTRRSPRALRAIRTGSCRTSAAPAIRSRPVSARIRCRFPSSTKFTGATSASSSMRCRNSQCLTSVRHSSLPKKSLRDFFAKLLSELQNQFL